MRREKQTQQNMAARRRANHTNQVTNITRIAYTSHGNERQQSHGSTSELRITTSPSPSPPPLTAVGLSVAGQSPEDVLRPEPITDAESAGLVAAAVPGARVLAGDRIQVEHGVVQSVR